MVELVLTHWAFVAVALVLSVGGLVAKRTLWQPDMVHRGGIWRLGADTMPLHPVVLGGIVGLIPGMPTAVGIDTVAGRILYYALSGVVSTYAYDVLRRFAERAGAPQ